MAANGDGVEGSNSGSRRKDAIGAAIEEQRQQMNEIRELLVGLGLNPNRKQRVAKNRAGEVAREPFVNRLIRRHALNFNGIPCFDDISYKEDFID